MNISCEICANDSFKSVYEKDSINVVKCSNCSALRLSDFNIGELSNHYSRKIKYTDRIDFEKVKKLSDLSEFIKKDSNTRLLDVGCGKGDYIRYLSSQNINVEGLEPNPSFNIFYKNIPVSNNFIIDDLYKDNTFDIITLIQVLEHLDNPVQKLETLRRYLKPDGTIVINVPSYNNPRILLYRYFGFKSVVKKDFIKQHLYYYTPKTLSNVLNKSGFEVYRIECGRYNTKFGPNLIFKFIDKICNSFGIGGIMAYAKKKI